MSTERDTHFSGFAKLLMSELDELFDLLSRVRRTKHTPNHDEYVRQIEIRIQTLLAQRAYDLVYSFAEHAYTSKGLPPMRGEMHVTVQMLPDLTAWPSE